ncbi:MAG: glycosyltransferase family 4 protein [Thermoanaerobaculia bacterium]|nr:glycosyltransferase family 4 protein [Thermoanaerobaculia bacterium]
MSRILLLCPEPLGHGQPAGVGIRFLEFARALLAEGHSVTILSADGGTVEGCAAAAISPAAIRDASRASDVAVLQGHVANEFVAHAAPIPLVVDLYDPYIVENLHYFDERGEQVFVHDHATLLRSLRQGDFFLCASEAQRFFYLGMLISLGRLNPVAYRDDRNAGNLLAVAPFGVPPPREIPPRRLDEAALLFGGIYDWYEPLVAIEAVAIARKRISGLTLSFNRHPNALLTPQSKAAEAERHVREKGYDSFVTFEQWTPYEERAAFFDRFAASILTFPRSIETDLALRTRILDYLWAGLPVITSPGRGTDEIILRHRAGVVVDSNDPAEFAKAIVDLLTDRDRVAAMVAGAATFASENQWARTVAPLLDFCRNPRIDPAKHSFPTDGPSAAIANAPSSLFDKIRRRLGGRT